MNIANYFDNKSKTAYIQDADYLKSQTEEPVRIPIINKIPRFVQNENYAESFGLQWNIFRKIELDSYTGINLSRERLERCLDGNLSNLKDKTVLEVGCGAGRFTEILLAVGAKVVSMDLSSAVDANAENFPVNENHQIVQCDIGNLPFQHNQFDAVICLGILQHTPSPHTTILDCINACKPGGIIAFDQYTTSLYRMLNIGRIFRFIIKIIPHKDNRFKTVKKIVDLYHPLHASPLFRKRPLSYLLAIFSPCASFYSRLPDLPEDLQYRWMLAGTHDSLTDHYKHLTNLQKMQELCITLPAKILKIIKDGNGVEVLLQKDTSFL